jgi:hypothetical protein
MRGFVFGFVLLVVFAVIVLSIRPGGLRQQLRLAARRFRIVLVLAGVYLVASTLLRLFVPEGPVSDFGLPALALVLGVIFVFAAQDPPTRDKPPSR